MAAVNAIAKENHVSGMLFMPDISMLRNVGFMRDYFQYWSNYKDIPSWPTSTKTCDLSGDNIMYAIEFETEASSNTK